MADATQESGTVSISTPATSASRPFARRTSRGEGPLRPVARPLPPELEFLAQHGVSPDRLLHAAAGAPGGVEPLDALLGEGIVAEEQYYHALAQHLGCPYYVGEPTFAEHFDAVKGLRCGVAPLAARGGEPRAVIAPRAQSVPRLIEMRAAGRLHPNSFAVTSPQRFAALVRMRRGEAVLADALERLPDSLSAKRGMSGGQIAAAGLIALSAFALGVADIHALVGVASLLLWLLFLASIVFRSAAAVAHGDDVRPIMLSDDELPVYTVVVAVYREEADVVADLIAALEALDYPVLCSNLTYAETQARIRGMRLPARYELVVAPPGEPSTKPRALNLALATARGNLVVVYDAEDAPAPDQLRLAASLFAAEPAVDCLQARLTIRNVDDSWLSSGIM